MSSRPGLRAERVRQVLTDAGLVGSRVNGWRDRAACAGEDPDLFFPVGAGPRVREQMVAAKRICAGCPVRPLCLAEVMAVEDPASRWGIAGGLTASERAALLARLRSGRAA